MTISRTTVAIFFSTLLLAVPTLASTARPLGAVLVNGCTAYPAPQLFTTYSHALGQPITGDAARTISTALADLYVRDGLVKPQIAVDDALANSGVLRLQVFEARITRVTFEGGQGRHQQALQAIADRLTAASPLRVDDVPGALRDMRALAGMAVTATARSDGARRHGYELVVKTEFSPVDGMVRMNNRGTAEVGPAFVMGQLFANGLAGRQERIGLIFTAATDVSEFLGGGVLLDAPLGAGDTRASLLVFRSRSAPHEQPADLEDRYVRNRLTARVAHTLFADSPRPLVLSGGLEASDLTIDRAGATIREDKLRILEAGLRGGWQVGVAQLSANLQLRKGLDGLGAGLRAPDLADDPRRADFLLTQLQATVSRRFATQWTARLDAFTQYSGHVLPDSERFKIGGDRLGRGFEVAEIAGDRGLGGKAELRRIVHDAGGVLGRMAAYGFYDIGAAWKQDQPGHEAAATSGLGLALSGAALTGYLEVATPVSGADIEGKRDASVFAELSWRF